MQFSMEVLNSALAILFLGQLIGGVAWLLRLGGRVASLELKLTAAEANATAMSSRMAKVEETQGQHTTQLAVIWAGVDEVRQDTKDLKRG